MLSSRCIMARMAKKYRKFGDQIRDAVRASGMSQYRLAKNLRISESAVSRFMSGKTGLTLKRLDKVAKLLDLHVVVIPPKRKAK